MANEEGLFDMCASMHEPSSFSFRQQTARFLGATFALLILLPLHLPACGDSSSAQEADGSTLWPDAEASDGAPDADGSSPDETKQPITGLIAMGSPVGALNHEDPLNEVKIHPGVYSGVVINAIWMYLEPEKEAYDFSTIDEALAAIQTYNEQHPERPLAAKLRIFGGTVAPTYVKELGGGPITVKPSRGPEVEIGLFWTEAYGDRFAALLAQLALRYDDDPLIREVCVSTAASLTAEPFVAPLNRESNPMLREHGFNDALYKQAIRRALDDYRVWKLTAIDFPFNVFSSTDDGWVSDPEFTKILMRDFRERYGERAVLSNHGLIDPLTESSALIYPTLKELGPPIAFQTRGPQVDFEAAIRLGFEYGMTEFEMWDTVEAGGLADVSYETLQQWAGLFPPKND